MVWTTGFTHTVVYAYQDERGVGWKCTKVNRVHGSITEHRESEGRFEHIDVKLTFKKINMWMKK